MHCLFLGNGLNRLSQQYSWLDLLNKISLDLGLHGTMVLDASKPLSLHFEELCVRVGDFAKARDAESDVKKRIADLIGTFPAHPILGQLVDLFQVILTTNYDFSIENALSGGLRSQNTVLPESRYSLFRRCNVGLREVWHVHGDADHPQSILLGYDHYAGYLQKIRNYVTSEVPSAGRNRSFRSPLKAGMLDFEKYDIHSWVDHFLRDHLHIVGFGFDFTEIDLWWLLVHKRRRTVRTGKTFVYLIDLEGNADGQEAVKLSLFRSLGVEPVIVRAANYADGYQRILEAVNRNIRANEGLIPTVASPSRMTDKEADEIFMLDRAISPLQMSLTLSRRSRTRKAPLATSDG